MTTYKLDTTASSTDTVNIHVRTMYDLNDLMDVAKLVRKGYGFTQKELADLLGVSRSTVSRAERTPEQVNLGYWYKYAHFLRLEMGLPKWGFKKGV